LCGGGFLEMMCCRSVSGAHVVKRDDSEPPVFDDETSKSDASPVPDQNATVIDQALGHEVAIRLRELRQEMASRSSDPDKTTFSQQPTFDDDDEHPTMWEAKAGRLGSAIPVTTQDEPEHTERALIPIIEPPKPEPPIEYTRKEPIPMELFFETSSDPVSVPMSARPPQPAKLRGRSAGPPLVLPVVEPAAEPAEQTMLDVAAQVGLAPEVEKKPSLDEDTFDEVAEAVKEAARDVPEPQKEEAPKLPLPTPIPEIDLLPFVEEEQAKAKRSPREGAHSQDIRRYAASADVTARLIPIILGVFVIVSTLYGMVAIIQSMATKTDEHVELRFLATLNGTPSEMITRQGAKMTRIYIETTPPELIVLHNRAILGKTPITVDLPIELSEEIGVELSSPYYETWISQVKRESDEYRIRAELTKK
jgi:hypothetical protein